MGCFVLLALFFHLDLFIIARLRNLFMCDLLFPLIHFVFLGAYSLSLDGKHCSKLSHEFGQLFNAFSRSALKDIATHTAVNMNKYCFDLHIEI